MVRRGSGWATGAAIVLWIAACGGGSGPSAPRTARSVSRPAATGQLATPSVRGAVVAARSPGERDGDGIADADDLCADDAEDVDGFEDEDGCPDADNDQDRRADADDLCPSEPEPYDGIDDEDGCPDRAVTIVEDVQLVILDKIYFARGAARIEARAVPIVEAIAATFQHNPQIARVEVQGHASDDEADAWSLAAARADAVRAVLIERGVAAERLLARGYGATRPIDPRTTLDALERNRRVELLVLDAGAEARSAGSAPHARRAPAVAFTGVERLVRELIGAARAAAGDARTQLGPAPSEIARGERAQGS